MGLDAKARERMMGASSENPKAGPEKIQEEMKELLNWWKFKTEKQRARLWKQMKLEQEQPWKARKAA